VRPGLYGCNQPLYALGAGQHGLIGRDNSWVSLARSMPPGRPRCERRFGLRDLRRQDAGGSLSIGPS
jgi:hypothetical protein